MVIKHELHFLKIPNESVVFIKGSFHSMLIPGHQFLKVFKIDPDMF